jgi:hypothetical protein
MKALEDALEASDQPECVDSVSLAPSSVVVVLMLLLLLLLASGRLLERSGALGERGATASVV